jgi:hypothetical protein
MHPVGHEDGDAVELHRLEPLAGHLHQQVGKRFQVQDVDQGARLTRQAQAQHAVADGVAGL